MTTFMRPPESTTTPDYWDCECPQIDPEVEPYRYIHPKSHVTCGRCGAMAEDQPDSMITEVEQMLAYKANQVQP